MVKWKSDCGGGYKKCFIIAAISYHVIILFVFKYLSFFAQQLGLLIFQHELSLEVALPIGISFYSFQMMSYLWDVYYEKSHIQNSYFKLMLYFSLFPQLIAGPIVRYNQIESEIDNRSVSYDDFVIGMKRFIYGLAKKVLIANYVAQIADNTFDFMGEKSVVIAWIGAVSYTLQIYFDFSGYSDMAIGIGRMFGFHFTENFNYPYIAGSITDFWRRWHISLSQWFRDYVYIPLGGNRVNKKRYILNLFIVWSLTGIWHGANWTFLIWGWAYFCLLVFEKLTNNKGFVRNNYFGHVKTIIFVILLWVIFRSKNVHSALCYIGSMFGIGTSSFCDLTAVNYIKSTWFIIIIAIVGATPIYHKLIQFTKRINKEWIESIWILLIFCLSFIRVISSTYNPFIYFNF